MLWYHIESKHSLNLSKKKGNNDDDDDHSNDHGPIDKYIKSSKNV